MITLNDAWLSYRDTILVCASKNGLRNDAGRWKNHINDILGNLSLADITNRRLAQFKMELHGKNISQQTAAHCLGLVKRVMRKAVEWDMYSGPIPLITMPRFDNKRIRFLHPEEVKQLLQAIKPRSALWHDVSIFALYTGLRAGEIYNLTTEHLDLQHQLVTVVDSKNSKTRQVPLNHIATDIGKKYYKATLRTQPLFQMNGKRPCPTCKIFSRAVATTALNRGICDRRQKVVFHTLRHTFASWLVQSGTPLAVVSNMLGHSDLKVTMRYAHLSPEQGRHAIDNLPTI